MKEREAQNPGAELYTHWMQVTHQHARKALEQTREEMSKYYDRKARQQPDIKVGDLVMLNEKNIRTKQPTKKLSPRMHGPFKVLEVKKGERAFKLKYHRGGRSTQYFMSRYWNLIEYQHGREENNLHEFQKISKESSNGR